MPDGFDDVIDDGSTDPNPGQGGGGLRKQLEQVLAQNRTLTEQLAKVQTNERNRSLDALFAKHSIPEKARDFFPSDTDPTDEAATAFVEKYGELWGASAAQAATPPDQQAAAQAAQSFVSQSRPPVVSEMSEDDYRAKFAEANTKAEFLKMLAELGGA
jgi:hypothetical protein